MASKKFLSLTAATAALVLGLTACGNGDGGDSADGGEGSGEEFTFGILYPQTGSLAFLGPPQVTAAKYAIDEINKAGGILGTDVPAIVEADEAGDAAQANQAANDLVSADVNAVIGAAASAMTQASYDTVTAASIVQCSGSNTAPDLSEIDDNGYFFRTAPSDLLSGPVLARQMVDDGAFDVAVVARADDYGDGYRSAVEAELEALGANVVATENYDPDATNFDSVVNSVSSADPDAVALISFQEGAQVIAELIESGISGDQLYITDGLNDPELGDTVNSDDPDVVTGVTGVAPGADNPEFNEGLRAFDSELDVFQFAPQVFDCVTAIALAAESAGSVSPADYVEHLPEISRPDGTECGSFEECRDLLNDGEEIDFQGTSGNIDFDDNGDPTSATFEVFHFGDDGYETLGFEEYSVDE
ncbi:MULTISPECIES: ABC transporter substrate-binding protein [unclassified Nocardiopsis]|jgi:branched-chain amino acid transport system substrate-binding protein|uniref:ABC transporter substrate-binding protein n=1 Tax=unclassified Nocardiopsis TaxID=2649073 RepID=UPI00066E09E5|nr:MULTISPECIES: ABC transporter substrate-binding protein [unclassified Nocardiopsis]MBQ1082747.1 ABC transporter substrate-binding protein [Nocardiopsis sp. B62]